MAKKMNSQKESKSDGYIGEDFAVGLGWGQEWTSSNKIPVGNTRGEGNFTAPGPAGQMPKNGSGSAKDTPQKIMVGGPQSNGKVKPAKQAATYSFTKK